MLEAAPEDIEVRAGKFAVKGSPDKGMTLAEVAGAAYVPDNLPEGWSPGSRRRRSTTRRTSCSRSARTRASSTSTPTPGRSTSSRYVAVDDCGPAINPMLIDGQVHGGIVHAIGQALYEQRRLRRGRPARDRHVRRLRAADGRRGAELRDRPHGDAVAGQLARRQGHRRGGHDRRVAGGRERRDRRAAPARRHATSTCRSTPDARVGGHHRREGRCA